MPTPLERYKSKLKSSASTTYFPEAEDPKSLSKIEIKKHTDSIKDDGSKFDLEVIDINEPEDKDLGFNDKIENTKNEEEKQSWKDNYVNWIENNKNPESFRKLMQSLQPTIDYALASNNAKGDPYIEAQAKILTANSIKSYDLSYETSLPTYLTSNLKKLTRIIRDYRSPVKIPENTFYELQDLKESEMELEDILGREPTVQEVADHMKIPIEKIEKLKNQRLKQVSENQYFNSESGDTNDDNVSTLSETNGEMPNYVREALAYTYASLDTREKKILEWSTGFGGAKLLPPSEIAKRLGISQSQVSRLTAKIAVSVEENLKALEN
jgi:DNA-directed RNA polymerase specialized sigma subunit